MPPEGIALSTELQTHSGWSENYHSLNSLIYPSTNPNKCKELHIHFVLLTFVSYSFSRIHLHFSSSTGVQDLLFKTTATNIPKAPNAVTLFPALVEISQNAYPAYGRDATVSPT